MLISYGPSTNKRRCVEHSVRKYDNPQICMFKLPIFKLYELSVRDQAVTGVERSFGANVIRSFNGGSKQFLMCRNVLFENPRNRTNLVAAVYDEMSNSVSSYYIAFCHCISFYPIMSVLCLTRIYFVTDERRVCL